MSSGYVVDVVDSYEIDLTIRQQDFQESLHDSMAYGIAREIQEGNQMLEDITGIEDFNRVLPEGYTPRKWYGKVEDWVITDSGGDFCIGQSVSRPDKSVIPQLGVRKDFYQAKMFEQRVMFDSRTYDNLTGVFVINLDEDYDDWKEFQREKDRELYRHWETDLSVVIHELEPSDRSVLTSTGKALEQMASD